MIDLFMPRLSSSTGTVTEWRVGTGSLVRKGELLALIEMDKTILELVSSDDGIVAEIRVLPGEKVAGGTLLARLMSIPSQDAMISHVWREEIEKLQLQSDPEPPPRLYVGIHTADPVPESSEPTFLDYAREEMLLPGCHAPRSEEPHRERFELECALDSGYELSDVNYLLLVTLVNAMKDWERPMREANDPMPRRKKGQE